MKNGRSRAFTLIELLVAIAVIFALLALSVGVIHQLSGKSDELLTRNTMNILHQALIVYRNAAGTYPVIENMANQYKLYELLANPLDIVDYQGNVLRTTKDPPIPPEDLLDEKIVRESPPGSGEYRFFDAWNGPFRYFYGGAVSGGHPYIDADTPNVNHSWGTYDLISFGKDGVSTRDDRNQEDDITNFK